MESVKPPESMNWTRNMDCEWRRFKQRFTLYLQAVGLDEKPDARKIALLLTVAGAQAVEVFNTFVFDREEDKANYNVILTKFDEHCSPRKNETLERFVFRSRIQMPAESFDAFLTDLKLKARTCNFGVLQDSMIRDQIVFGINDESVRERLLREMELTLAGAVNICHANELARQHEKTFVVKVEHEEDVAVPAASEMTNRGIHSINEQQKGTEHFKGRRCGSLNAPERCPTSGNVCNNFNGNRSYAAPCFSKRTQKGGEQVQDDSKHEDADRLIPKVNSVEQDERIVPVQTNGAVISVKVETGDGDDSMSKRDVEAKKTQDLPVVIDLERTDTQADGCTQSVMLNGQPFYLIPYPVFPSVAAVPRARCKAKSQSTSTNRKLDGCHPYVKKPPNAFMQFLKEERKHVDVSIQLLGSGAVNAALGQKWKSLSQEQQNVYYIKAKKEKELHEQQHPEWSAKDNYGKKKKRERKQH